MKSTNAQPPREAQRESVKTLAIAVGVREAARQMGIPEGTVQAWSARGKWFKQPELPPTITNPRGATIATKQPSDAMASVLADDNRETKLSLSRSIRKAAKHVDDELDGREVFQGSDKVKHLVQSASQLHNWEEKEQGSGVMGGLRVYSKQTIVNVATAQHVQSQEPEETGDAPAS